MGRKMSIPKAVITVMCVLFLAGCSFYRVDSKDMSTDLYPPKASAADVVFLEQTDKPYVLLGVVSVVTEKASPRQEVIARMRAEAAILGADAVTELVSDNASIHIRYNAKAVVFK